MAMDANELEPPREPPREPRDPRVALISGCSSGIGRLTARRLARAGWIVFAGLRRADDRHAAASLRQEGLRPVALDVTDAEVLRAAVEQVSAETAVAPMPW